VVVDQALRVFTVVAEKESFTRAAEELHMTQPAVSQYVQSLEREMGTRLLARTNKYVRLNKAGEVVYHHARQIVDLYAKMHYLVDELTNQAAGELSIGASFTYGEYILPHVVAKLLHAFPQIKPRITIGNTREIEELLLQHRLDVGIVEGGFKQDKLLIEPFSDDEMVVIAPGGHPLGNREHIAMAELMTDTWIIRELGSGTREAADRMFASFQCYPAKLMEFGSTQIIKESVEAGLGLALLSRWAVRKEVKLGSLQVLPVDGLPFVRKFSLVTVDTSFYSRSMEVFMQLVREHLPY
jgi:DNA-binding transcriptional LysR family regulator